MTAKSSNSSTTSNNARCQHVFSNGTRCRGRAIDPEARACARHAKLVEADIAASDLAAGLEEFKSAVPINEFLSRLLVLLAQNRISPRRAAVLAFISSQLLRTLSAIDRETADDDPGDVRPTIIWDMPGPERERLPAPLETKAIAECSAPRECGSISI